MADGLKKQVYVAKMPTLVEAANAANAALDQIYAAGGSADELVFGQEPAGVMGQLLFKTVHFTYHVPHDFAFASDDEPVAIPA